MGVLTPRASGVGSHYRVRRVGPLTIVERCVKVDGCMLVASRRVFIRRGHERAARFIHRGHPC